MQDLLFLLVITAIVWLFVLRLRSEGTAGWLPQGLLRRRAAFGASPALDPSEELPGQAALISLEGRPPVGADPSDFAGAPPLHTSEAGAVVRTPEAGWSDIPTAPEVSLPRRFGLGWIAASFIAVAAVWLESRLWENREDLGPFWALLACGVLFAILAATTLPRVGRRPAAEASPTSELPSATDESELHSDSAAQPGRRFRFDITSRPSQLLTLGVLAELLALACFERLQQPTLGWVLHLVAGPIFIAGIWQATHASLNELKGSWRRIDTALMAILIVVAFILRVWQVGEVPQGIWFDESQTGLTAMRMAADPQYRPVFVAELGQEPAAFWYFMIPFINLFGREALALRFPAVVGGALGVGAVYLLARALFDRRTAFVAAAFTLGMTWHFNFSRIAFNSIWSVALDALAAAAFVVALRRRSLVAFAVAGLIAGAGIHFYYTSRLIPVILLAVVLYRLVTERMAFVRAYGPGLALMAATFLLAAAPLVQFALVHPSEFSTRTATVTILREVQDTRSLDPVLRNLQTHLVMFNGHGDNNGRHNWTGHPMLDPVIGAMAVLGFALALIRIRRWEYVLLLVWFAVMLAGGVFSLSFEAPQGLRTIDEVTAAGLFAALAFATLWFAAEQVPGFLRQRRGAASAGTPAATPRISRWDWVLASRLWSWGIMAPADQVRVRTALAAVATMLLVVTAAANVQRYFQSQQQDSRTWLEFSTPLTEAARRINQLPPDATAYVDPTFVGQPTMLYLVAAPHPIVPFDPATSVPIAKDSAGIYLTEREPSQADWLAELYPTSPPDLMRVPDGGHVSLYSWNLNSADVQAQRGVQVRYESGESKVDRRELGLDFTWPAGSPLPAPFTATVSGGLAVRAFGDYQFQLEGPPDAAMLIDGSQVVTGGGQGRVKLATGTHALRLLVPTAGDRMVRVLWRPPNEGSFVPIPPSELVGNSFLIQGLKGEYFRGNAITDTPDLAQIDPTIDLKVHLLPLPRPYTLRWTGAIRAVKDGEYRFATHSVDSSSLRIDGRELLSNTRPGDLAETRITLTPGWHDIDVEFHDRTSFTYMELYWQPPGESRAIIPSDVLRPWSAETVPLAVPDDADLSRVRIRAPASAATAQTTQAQAPDSAPAAPTQADTILPPGTLSQPRGATAGPDGTLYVADTGKQGIVVIPPDGGETRVLAGGQLKEPSDVALLPNGDLVASDAGTGAVVRITPAGVIVERLVQEGLYGPRGVSVAPDGRIVVADTGNNRLLVIPQGGGNPALITGLREPTDAAFLPDGTFIVAEVGAKQFTVVRADGSRVSSWPMVASYTAVGPHLALLPRGGWVATSPESPGTVRMGPGDRQPVNWVADPTWKKPVGIAATAAGVIVFDADGGSVTRVGSQ